MQVRYRPLERDHVPRATALCLAVAAILFVCTDLLWAPKPGVSQPAWLLALYQSQAIWAGAVWKHLTSMFLHGGFIHVIFNSMALWVIGRAVERSWGTPAFLAILVATGMAGGAVEFAAHPASAVGLSGGILGLCGFLMARRKDHPTARAVMHDGNVRFLLIYVVACVVLTQMGRLHIANWAHGAGLGTGFLIGLASKHAKRKLLVPLAGLLCVALVVASVFLAFGEVTLEKSGEAWSRQQWRTYWLENHQ